MKNKQTIILMFADCEFDDVTMIRYELSVYRWNLLSSFS